MTNSIKLLSNGDRLGGNLSYHLAPIFYAYYYNLPISYGNENQYKHSIFMKALQSFINKYNKTADLKNKDNLSNFVSSSTEWYFMQAQTLSNIKLDYISYFKKYFYNEVRTSLVQNANQLKYKIPFDPKKTILIHLRLDDVKRWQTGTEATCNNIYRNFINNDNISGCSKVCRYRQAPINRNQLNSLINQAKSKYKDREVIIITNPGERLNLPYKVISNKDPNLDLYLLCNSEVIITSRSTYGFMPLLFGIVKEAWVPKWCHFAMFGLTTKYDKNVNLNYY